jgi:hypothetical protein
MSGSPFVGYVGDADIHDGSVLAVEHRSSELRVRVRGASGRLLVVDFRGVHSVRANCPEGMMLYALSELTAEPPLRRFAFTNWDEDGEEYLEVDALTFEVHEE